MTRTSAIAVLIMLSLAAAQGAEAAAKKNTVKPFDIYAPPSAAEELTEKEMKKSGQAPEKAAEDKKTDSKPAEKAEAPEKTENAPVAEKDITWETPAPDTVAAKPAETVVEKKKVESKPVEKTAEPAKTESAPIAEKDITWETPAPDTPAAKPAETVVEKKKVESKPVEKTAEPAKTESAPVAEKDITWETPAPDTAAAKPAETAVEEKKTESKPVEATPEQTAAPAEPPPAPLLPAITSFPAPSLKGPMMAEPAPPKVETETTTQRKIAIGGSGPISEKTVTETVKVPPVPPSLARRTDAAGRTALNHLRCMRLEHFYWEVGDHEKSLARGWVGRKFGEDTEMEISSAAKWVFASWVLEKAGSGGLDPDQIKLLTQRAGYGPQDLMACAASSTVAQCLDKMNKPQAPFYDIFTNNEGHMQKLAVYFDMRDYTGGDIVKDYKKMLGLDDTVRFYYTIPVVAEGMRATPRSYGAFLRRILSGDIRMKDQLGKETICTTAGAENCAAEPHNAAPAGWMYSLGHWVETGSDKDDGAYSAPGLFGFYPWITADKKFYGMVARKAGEETAAVDSVLCGREIRKAWDTGEAQE